MIASLLWRGERSSSNPKSPIGSTRSPTTSSVKPNATSTCSPTKAVLLSEPFTRQLDGKLRELRFYLARQPTRISYYIATGRIIVLLTVFTKTKPRVLEPQPEHLATT